MRRPASIVRLHRSGGSTRSPPLTAEISRTALELPPEDRLELARRLVESVVEPAALADTVKEGLRRIEDVATGRVAGLSEEHYRAASR